MAIIHGKASMIRNTKSTRFPAKMQTSRLSRRRQTVRPQTARGCPVVPRPPSKLLSCLRLNADLLAVTITMSSCQWPLIVVADSGCVVVLCAALVVSWVRSATLQNCIRPKQPFSQAAANITCQLCPRCEHIGDRLSEGCRGSESEGDDLWLPWIPDQTRPPHSDPWRHLAPMRFLLSYF